MAKDKTDIQDEAPEQDDATTALMEMAQELQAAAGNKQKQGEALRKLETFLIGLDPKDHPDLAKSPVVQRFVEQLGESKAKANPGDVPGTIYNRGTLAEAKKPWSGKDVWSKYPSKTFTPTETIPIIFDGVKVQLFAEVEVTLPSIFYDIYAEHRKSTKAAHEHAAWLMRAPNAGPPSSDPTILSEASQRVRSQATTGSFYPGAGGFTPGADTDEGKEAAGAKA